MANVYVKFKLTPGMSPPADGYATGIAFDGDWICWYGPEGTFPTNDPASSSPFTQAAMNQTDIDAYDAALIAEPPTP